MNWDEVVDVVCTEAGPGGLASAIATVDGGADVFVATSTRVDGARPSSRSARGRTVCPTGWASTCRFGDHGVLCSPFRRPRRWTGGRGMSMCPSASSPSPSPEPSRPRGRAVHRRPAQRLGRTMPHLALWLALHPRGGADTPPRCARATATRSKSLRSVRLSRARLNSKARRLPTGSWRRRAIEASRYTRPARCSGSCSRTARWWVRWSRPQTAPTRFVPDTGFRWHRADHWSTPSHGMNCSAAMRPRGYALSAGTPAGSAGSNC